MAIRLQIVCDSVLIAECVVEESEAQRTWARFTQAKNAKRKPIGGAVTNRADLPRYWNVPVGASIR